MRSPLNLEGRQDHKLGILFDLRIGIQEKAELFGFRSLPYSKRQSALESVLTTYTCGEKQHVQETENSHHHGPALRQWTHTSGALGGAHHGRFLDPFSTHAGS